MLCLSRCEERMLAIDLCATGDVSWETLLLCTCQTTPMHLEVWDPCATGDVLGLLLRLSMQYIHTGAGWRGDRCANRGAAGLTAGTQAEAEKSSKIMAGTKKSSKIMAGMERSSKIMAVCVRWVVM